MKGSSKQITMCFIVSVVLAELSIIQGAHIVPTRVKRGIFGTVTMTTYKTIEKKYYVPASCVHVAPNLPDCRNVRFLNYPSFDTSAFNFFTGGNELTQNVTEKDNTPKIETKSNDDAATPPTVQIQGWGEYLGFYRPTVMVTELKIQPTTVLDHRIMVTYDIRGCKPHDLPHNLERCPEENSMELVEIIPTATMATDMKATRAPTDGLEGSEFNEDGE